METRLQPRLDSITEQTRKLVQPERLAPADRFVREASAATPTAISVGQGLPPFALRDANGRLVRSEDLLALGPLILKFFRGRWDPYCSTELESWRDLYPLVRAMGTLLVAISPQTIRQNDFLVSQHSLPFPVLRDEGCRYAAELGMAQHLPEYLQTYYRGILVNIPFINGEKSWTLPVAGTVIARRETGEVVSVEAYPDFRTRPEPQRALEIVASL